MDSRTAKVGKLATVLAGVCLWSLAGAATALNPERTQQLQQLMRLTGVSQQLQQVPQIIEQGVAQSLPPSSGITADMQNQLTSALVRSFGVSRIEKQVLRGIGDRLDNSDIVAIRTWYQKPLGERLVATEIRNSASAQIRAMSGENANLTGYRQRLIDNLDRAVLATESASQNAIDMQASVTYSLMSSMGGQHSYVDIYSAVAQEILNQRSAIRQVTRATLAFMYEDLTDQDLEAYIQFALTGPATRFVAGASSGFGAAVVESAEDFAASLKTILASNEL